MDSRIAELLGLAFRVEPAVNANTAIAEVRNAEGGEGEPVRSYELLLPAEPTLEWLGSGPLQRLVYHLESVRARPPSFDGTVVAAFSADRVLFLRAADFLPTVARLLGVTVDELFSRHGTGELRTAVGSGSSGALALTRKPE